MGSQRLAISRKRKRRALRPAPRPPAEEPFVPRGAEPSQTAVRTAPQIATHISPADPMMKAHRVRRAHSPSLVTVARAMAWAGARRAPIGAGPPYCSNRDAPMGLSILPRSILSAPGQEQISLERRPDNSWRSPVRPKDDATAARSDRASWYRSAPRGVPVPRRWRPNRKRPAVLGGCTDGPLLAKPSGGMLDFGPINTARPVRFPTIFHRFG